MKQFFFIILSCLVITLSGCDKKLEKINIDPTRITPQNMQFNYLFTSAEIYTAGAGFGLSLMYSPTIMQQLSSTSTFPGDKYIYDEGSNGDFWRSQYSSSIKSIVNVIENIKQDEKRQNLYNISRILKAFLFQRITDLYGDIPYSEAGFGFINASTSPKYDFQKDIYAHLLAELEDAAQKLDVTADNTVGEADLFYGGDVAKWKRFAYSEMLRLAMRMTKVAPDSAKKWSQKAVQGGVMESNEDNAICPHDAKGLYSPVSNPVGAILVAFAADYRLSETFIKFLKDNDDPRLRYLATVKKDVSDNTDLGDNNPAIQLGQPNGYDNRGGAEDLTNAPNWPGDQNKYSVIYGGTFAREDAPTFILTYAETSLLLAEAAQRGWISGTASDYYNKGVKAAVLQLNQANAAISPAEADDYLNAHPY
ncbi:MAG: SusD/RagB family nutrient-binding outer membrane lipoprotein, partial [Ginsengibacter sp.]